MFLQSASYRAMVNASRSQSILVSVESGVGKTETTKLIMQYLTYVGDRSALDDRTVEQQVLTFICGNRSPSTFDFFEIFVSWVVLLKLLSYKIFILFPTSRTLFWRHLAMQKQLEMTTQVEVSLLQCLMWGQFYSTVQMCSSIRYCLLIVINHVNSTIFTEYTAAFLIVEFNIFNLSLCCLSLQHFFGCSRFGKSVEIQFNASGTISGAAVRTYLLERSRVVRITDPEMDFHCFYQLYASEKAPPRQGHRHRPPSFAAMWRRSY